MVESKQQISLLLVASSNKSGFQLAGKASRQTYKLNDNGIGHTNRTGIYCINMLAILSHLWELDT